MSVFKKLIKIVLLISIILFFISYFQRGNLPERKEILEELYQDPKQTEIEASSFPIQEKEFTYKIVPKYSYELYGLIVSCHDSESWFDVFHEKDPLNTKDICVVWGDNTKNGVYQKMKFTHGEFTCYARFKPNINPSWYSEFSGSQISNSHLLPKDERIYKAMKEATVGEQIYLKGYLVDYSIESTEGIIRKRDTSTIRTDTGNGACEIVYVTDFQILKKGNLVYSLINRISKYSAIVCFILLLIFLFKPEKKIFPSI